MSKPSGHGVLVPMSHGDATRRRRAPDRWRQALLGARRRATRALLLLAAGVLLGGGAAGCGGTARPVGPAKGPTAASTAPGSNTITSSVIPPGQRVRGDGDADNPDDLDGNGDTDGTVLDRDDDQPVPASYRFPDRDDAATFAYGRRARPAVERAVAAVVRGYYAAAAAADGATACALLQPDLARSTPESYAGKLAPAYMRGAGATCAAVLARLFQHDREELAAPVEVAAVRVQGNTALVILSSRTLRASELYLARLGRSWRLVEVLARPLP